MISSFDLRRVAVFSDLPEIDIDWFLGHLQEVSVGTGEIFVRQGDPAEWMFIFLEGLFQWRGEFGGDTVSLPAQAGEVSGVFPFSRMKRFSVTGRALTDGRLGKFPAVLFPELSQRIPELTARLVAAMSDRIREGTRIEQQRDRLESLGRLAAGLAHELNNPASAARRTGHQMRETLEKLRRANAELWRIPLDESEKTRIEAFETSLLHSELNHIDGIALGDLEEKLESILQKHGHAESWDIAAAFAKCGVYPDTLTSFLTSLEPTTAQGAIARIAASAEFLILVNTIERSTTRISDLVGTVKEYTCMDQAPVQNVDVRRSLDTTLDALAHILQPGIEIRRAYEPVPLLVDTVESQLNQVWTNIIENAVEAMAGQGELVLRTFYEDHSVVVEIGDNGPGIPPKIKPFIFEPFFTTKGVGAGTGLGLNTVRTIVRKLGGNIQVTSTPGDTRFQVSLECRDAPEPSGSMNGE